MTQEKHTPEEQPHRSGKPVLIYIMILFIAAFLLMALSMLMHQRTTSEGIGELQHSFSAMADMQAHQEKDAGKKDFEQQSRSIGGKKGSGKAPCEYPHPHTAQEIRTHGAVGAMGEEAGHAGGAL